MKTYYECISCFIRQAVDAVRYVTDDAAIHERVIREVLETAAGTNLALTPPAMAQKIHRIIRRHTGNDDPYRQVKRRFTDFSLRLADHVRGDFLSAKDPFEAAVRLAIAGNIIDLGAKSSLTMSDTEAIIKRSLTDSFDTTELNDFRCSVEQAEDIMYLADNAGEIVFDRFLIEQIGVDKVTLAVKGSAVINDATMEDAQNAGLTGWVRVMDNGDDAPGTILESCSDAFQRRFEQSDLVIAKGQGNYETLSDVDKAMYFILKVKCSVIADDLDCPVGKSVLRYKSAKTNSFVPQH